MKASAIMVRMNGSTWISSRGTPRAWVPSWNWSASAKPNSRQAATACSGRHWLMMTAVIAM